MKRGNGWVKMVTKNILFLLLAQVVLSGAMIAQSKPAPIYPTDPHPAQTPNPEQDRAPDG
ncbi:MAG: hypothetical protein WB762_20425 [Candidatus Sulfotelmatobacter sp.]